jgi:hypothetical protein
MTGPPTDMTSLAQLFPPHQGPTILYLNFDGGSAPDDGHTDQVSSFQPLSGTRDQAVQDILFRVSEIFAPFNVEVERIYGAGSYAQGNGNTTIFIGGNSTDIAKDGTKQPAGFTPASSSDYPSDPRGHNHRPNSDPYDIGFVDPVQGPDSNPGHWTTIQDDAGIALGVAHESGHTFGLGHVRSDRAADGSFASDPASLGGGTVNDVMSYNGNTFAPPFANRTLNVTDWNNSLSGHALASSLQPKWDVPDPTWGWLGFKDTISIGKQDSYTYLEAALGDRDLSGDATTRLADTSLVDPSFLARSPATGSIGNNDVTRAAILHPGDAAVFTVTSLRGLTSVTLQDLPSSKLDPVMLLYDRTGTRLLGYAHGVKAQLDLPVDPFSTPLGSSFKVVVAGFDGVSTGGYELFQGPLDQSLWTSLGGQGIQQVVTGSNADGRVQVFALGGDGAVYSQWQMTTGGWSGWAFYGGSSIRQIAAGRDAGGRLELFAVGGDQNVYTMTQVAPNGGWGGWSWLGGGIVKSVSVGKDQDGRLELFTIDTNGTVLHRRQASTAGSWVPYWEYLSFGSNSRLTQFGVREIELDNRADGRIEVFAVSAGLIETATQAAPNGGPNRDSWTAWTTLGPTRYDVAQIAVGKNADGHLQLFVLDGGGSVSTIAESGPSGYWSYTTPWASLGGRAIASISVGSGPDGRLWLFAIGSDDHVYDQAETTVNGGFSLAWKKLGGTVKQIARANEVDQSLDVFGLSYDTGTAYRRIVASPPQRLKHLLTMPRGR